VVKLPGGYIHVITSDAVSKSQGIQLRGEGAIYRVTWEHCGKTLTKIVEASDECHLVGVVGVFKAS